MIAAAERSKLLLPCGIRAVIDVAGLDQQLLDSVSRGGGYFRVLGAGAERDTAFDPGFDGIEVIRKLTRRQGRLDSDHPASNIHPHRRGNDAARGWNHRAHRGALSKVAIRHHGQMMGQHRRFRSVDELLKRGRFDGIRGQEGDDFLAEREHSGCLSIASRRVGSSAKMVAMDRSQAWEILCEFTKSDSLRRHALAVETCVTAYARKFNEDETKWSVTALLHDFDYEIHPDAPDHPMKGEPMLAERGVDAEIRRAILSHANYSGVSRDSMLEKTLFACDELAGFLTACSYVKPGKSIHEVELKSVRKKLKDKAFARSVSRDDIENGAAGMGLELDQHIEFCIEAMKLRAAELGLAGTEAGASTTG